MFGRPCAAPWGKTAPADRGRSEQHATQEDVDKGDRIVMGPANRLRTPQHPPWRKQFPCRHQSEHAKEKPQSDHRIVAEEKRIEIHGTLPLAPGNQSDYNSSIYNYTSERLNTCTL